MTHRHQALRNMIAQQRAAGLNPQELHLNAATRDEFVRETGIKPKAKPDTRSTLDRALGRGTPPETVLAFEDVPLVTNEEIPGAAIILRPQQLMGDPLWLRNVQFRREGQPRLPADGSTPWMQPTPDNPQEGDETSPEALARGGGVNPTTCLFKAYENLDRVQDIVVLRFFKNGDIDMTSTFNRYGIVGGLQAALGYVMNNPDA